MKKVLSVIFLCVCFASTYAQYDIRTLAMRSDAIVLIDTDDVDITDVTPNDYTTEKQVKFSRIDTTYKNNTKIKLIKNNFKVSLGDEDFISNQYLSGSACFCPPVAVQDEEIDKKYYILYFLRKQNNTLVVHAFTRPIEKDNDYFDKLNAVLSLEKIKNLSERYEKTMDYFIDNDFYPDRAFLDFYIIQGFISEDEINLTDFQKIKAKTNFVEGKENLYPLIKPYYPDEIKDYYLQKMRRIKNDEANEWHDYWNFQEAYNRALNIEYGYNPTEEGEMMEKLLEEDISEEEKLKIMEYLIDFIKNQ